MEYKFRGKRLDNGEWHYGGYFRAADGATWILGDDGLTYRPDAIEVNPATVGQYAGLKDKTNREIYEGDIVVEDGYLWFDDGEPNYRGTVEWIYSQWQVVAHCINPNKRGISDGINEGLNDEGVEDGENSDWEVIGNIHDNPDLLEVQP